MNEIISACNLTYVHRRIGHHAAHSGYSALFEAMEVPVASSLLGRGVVRLLPRSLKWRLHRLRPQPVGDEGLIPELQAFSHTSSRRSGICHFIYGEDTYFYTPLWKNQNRLLVASYHYPPCKLEKRVNPAVIGSLDAVILMASNQKAWFEQYLPAERIHVVPHHVDTEFFCPGRGSEKETAIPYRVVCVGRLFRDIDCLQSLIELLTDCFGASSIEFCLLLCKESKARFSGRSNVTLYSDLTDEELRELYRSATIGLMPLVDCTANNSLLEMMACGLPVACSDVGGVRDYLDDKGALLFSTTENVNDIAGKVVELLQNKESRKLMGRHNRIRAEEHFSYTVSFARLSEVYQQLYSKFEQCRPLHNLQQG